MHLHRRFTHSEEIPTLEGDIPDSGFGMLMPRSCGSGRFNLVTGELTPWPRDRLLSNIGPASKSCLGKHMVQLAHSNLIGVSFIATLLGPDLAGSSSSPVMSNVLTQIRPTCCTEDLMIDASREWRPSGKYRFFDMRKDEGELKRFNQLHACLRLCVHAVLQMHAYATCAHAWSIGL